MRELKITDRGKRVAARGAVAVFYCALLVPAAAGLGYAQAGRRVAKPKSDPPVQQSAEPAATPTPAPKPKETEKVSLVVGNSSSAMMSRLSLNAGDMLQGAVVQRLRDSATLQIASGGQMTRGEATKRAKSDTTKTYVVWFELQEDSSRIFDPANSRGGQEFYVRYVVLEPVTAKVKIEGSVYLRPPGSSRIGGIGIGRNLPRCYPQGLQSVEFALVEAGIETAERIFRAFYLPNPPFCS